MASYVAHLNEVIVLIPIGSDFDAIMPICTQAKCAMHMYFKYIIWFLQYWFALSIPSSKKLSPWRNYSRHWLFVTPGAPFTSMDWIKSQHGYVITSIIKYGVRLFIHSRIQLWSLGMDKWFRPPIYRACDYLPILGIKLIYVDKKGPWGLLLTRGAFCADMRCWWNQRRHI